MMFVFILVLYLSVAARECSADPTEHMNQARSEILMACNVPEPVDGPKESDSKQEPAASAAPGASATPATPTVDNKSEHEKKGGHGSHPDATNKGHDKEPHAASPDVKPAPKEPHAASTDVKPAPKPIIPLTQDKIDKLTVLSTWLRIIGAPEATKMATNIEALIAAKGNCDGIKDYINVISQKDWKPRITIEIAAPYMQGADELELRTNEDPSNPAPSNPAPTDADATPKPAEETVSQKPPIIVALSPDGPRTTSAPTDPNEPKYSHIINEQ